ncbi:hypothetical protein A6S26_05660 [Nostoc sp. ATCC 43529]|nr:hypothetical protein A6S26_05660 [Nostoc sp. ATCC 43529]
MAFETASLAVKTLNAILKDYNFWGQSESDSPLKAGRTKAVIDDDKLLSLDRSLRIKAGATSDSIPKDRIITTKTLDEVFVPLAKNAIAELNNQSDMVDAGTATLESLANEAEAVEYYVQLYEVFKQLTDAKICYVDSPTDAEVGLFIVGAVGSETVYARTLLIQT